MQPVAAIESYARGPAGAILRSRIGDVFLQTAAAQTKRPAVVSRHQGIRWTWDEFAREALRVSAGLRALGLRDGDRVGVWATNCAEWMALQFGSAIAGTVLVNINPAYREHELSGVLKRSSLKAIFLHERDRRSDYQTILDESLADERICLQHAVHIGTDEWTAFLREPDGYAWCGSPGEPANIQYTSGTTGEPKGVLLSHVNLVNNGRFIAQYMQITSDDRICLPVPLFHCFGCVIGTMMAAQKGAAIILPSPAFDALSTLEAIHDERATAVYGVPTMFISELQHPEFNRFDLASLRTGVMAGSPCPIELMRRVVSEMHCRELVVGYGQTESSPIITMSRVDDPLETRCTTVGCPAPETEVRIVSVTTGETLPVGEQGELVARGYMVMKGYDSDPEATRKVIDEDGWLHTGDLATMREDGYFHITGRARDMIIRGGENVYPREIEEFLYTHPKVAEVQVVGLPDERLGETVLAWVKLKTGETAEEEEIRAFCRQKLAYFKVPQYVRFVDTFPRTLSGKEQKFKIRQWEIKQRGLQHLMNVKTA